jgi:hypothetical protein
MCPVDHLLTKSNYCNSTGAEGGLGRASQERYLPPEMWDQVFEFLKPSELARVASVSRTWKSLCFDNHHWSRHFTLVWSPEHCVSPLLPL